ncbi:hypothetical protein [Sorangium sp. So ce406]|uniref:hypothetical protein n=1 Tax=Sorangium sp. So ce406 TaxID=3133311 RepID=UPI003F5AF6CF
MPSSLRTSTIPATSKTSSPAHRFSTSEAKFPYGDFEKLHRCGVIAAEVRAAQYEDREIEVAAAHLHGALNALV